MGSANPGNVISVSAGSHVFGFNDSPISTVNDGVDVATGIPNGPV